MKKGVFLGTFQPPTKRRPVPHRFLLQGVVPDGVKGARVVVGMDQQISIPLKPNIISVEGDVPIHVKQLLLG